MEEDFVYSTFDAISDVEYIFRNKASLKDPTGKIVSYTEFLSMRLHDVIAMVKDGGWRYQRRSIQSSLKTRK